jgi:hypothetical protein
VNRDGVVNIIGTGPSAGPPVFAYDHRIATVTWPDLGVEMVFDRFHEDRRSHELTAEITCWTGSNGTRDQLHRGRLNLGSTRAR